MNTNNDLISKTIKEGNEITEIVKQKFGNLPATTLNTKPSAKAWSIGQCLDHLIVLNSTYFTVLDQLAAGTYAPSFWAKISPFSGFWGNMLIKSIDPNNLTKVKTQPVWQPTQSDVAADIVSRFAMNQAILLQKIEKLAHLNPDQVVITSPAAGFITYSLGALYKILVLHEKRHTLQAENVLKSIQNGS